MVVTILAKVVSMNNLFRVKSISLENYRGFEKHTFVFDDDDMSVFIGRNASGKTAIIEAINVMLGAYLAAYQHLVPGSEVANLRASDVFQALAPSFDREVVTSPFAPQYPCSVSCNLCINDKEFSFSRMLTKERGRTSFGGSNPMQPMVSRWERALMESGDSDKAIVLPLVLYFSSARLWNAGKKNSSFDLPKRSDGYRNCLNRERGIEWSFEYLKQLSIIASQENGQQALPAYKAILSAIETSMKEELPEGDSLEISYRYNGELVQKKKSGVTIPFSSLSDGYRNIIKVVTDIAVRMCVLNPHLKEEALSETPGIVLIDEIDLSLHPTWQRRIVNTLHELFPKIQFICATHSPFIIQSLQPGELIPVGAQIDTDYSGNSIEDIAEEIMGVEIPQYSEHKLQMYRAAEDYYRAVNKAESEEDIERLRVQLAELSKRFGSNPAYYAFLEQEKIVRENKIKENNETR